MNKKLKKYGIIFLGPIILAFVIVFIIPSIMGIYLSFCNFTTVDNARFEGLENYLNVFRGGL